MSSEQNNRTYEWIATCHDSKLHCCRVVGCSIFSVQKFDNKRKDHSSNSRAYNTSANTIDYSGNGK